MVKVVVADQTTIRFAAELTILFLVELFEDWALIPTRSLVAAHGLAQVVLGNVQDANLEHFIGIGVVDQIFQSAP